MKFTINTADMTQDFIDYNCKVQIVFYKNKKVEIYPLSYIIDEDDKNVLEIIKIRDIADYGAIKRIKVYQVLQNEIMTKKSKKVEVTFK